MEEQVPVTQAPTPQAAPEAAAQPDTKPVIAAPASAPAAAPEPPKEQTAEERHAAKLQAILESSRQNKQKQQSENQYRDYVDKLRMIEEAKKYGPAAVLKAVGIEQEPLDINKLLGDPQAEQEPESIREIKRKLDAQDQYIRSLQEREKQQEQEYRQREQLRFQEQEIKTIESVVEKRSSDFQYINALKKLGSSIDVYNLSMQMYNSGHAPTHEQVADLVESRVETLLDSVKDTPKFKEWVKKVMGPVTPQTQVAPTLTGRLNSETPVSGSFDNETDEENKARSLREAMKERERLMALIKQGQPPTKG
jgi:hypothetical protein